MTIEYEHVTISTNGIELHTVQAGPADGPAIILLHGFPEFWYGWKNQIPALAAAGYRVIAPDQRGYNLSDKPRGIVAYNLDQLAADLIGLIDSTGRSGVHLIGHDWGGAVAWWAANKHPQRFERMVILNVPHHRIFGQHIARSRAQRRKSWYFVFFRLPILPEITMRLVGLRAFGKGQPGCPFTSEDFARYKAAWAQPGALRGMINWYRAIQRSPPERLPGHRIEVPTLLIWGKRDAFLGHEMAQPSIDLCDDGRLVFFDDATHWVQHDKPDEVNQLLLDFLAG